MAILKVRGFERDFTDINARFVSLMPLIGVGGVNGGVNEKRHGDENEPRSFLHWRDPAGAGGGASVKRPLTMGLRSSPSQSS